MNADGELLVEKRGRKRSPGVCRGSVCKKLCMVMSENRMILCGANAYEKNIISMKDLSRFPVGAG